MSTNYYTYDYMIRYIPYNMFLYMNLYKK